MTIGEIIFVVIWWLLLAGLIAMSISIRCDKKKKPKNKTDYPYLPLDMVTKHFGWSYEYVDKKGWRYVIWYKSSFCSVCGGESVPVKHEGLTTKSRVEADRRCRELENEYFGPEDYAIYRREELTKDDVIEPSDVTLEELLFNKERKMKAHKIKDVQLVQEDSKLYLDITYELEDNKAIEELHIPRVEIPLFVGGYPAIERKNDPDYDGLVPAWFPLREVVCLNTGNDTKLKIHRDSHGNYFTFKTIKEKTQEMTIAEIEKKLGHKIKIISEDKKK